MFKPVILMLFDTGRRLLFRTSFIIDDSGAKLPTDQQSSQNLGLKINRNEVIKL